MMQREDEIMDSMSCKAPRLKLSTFTIPPHLNTALRHVYGLDYSYQKKKSNFDLNIHNFYIRHIENLSNIQTITQENYLMILRLCLYLMQFEQNLKIKHYKLLNHTVKKSHLKDCFIIDLKSFTGNHDHVTRCNVILNETLTKSVICTKVVEVLENKVTIKAYPGDADTLKNWILNKKFDIYFSNEYWPLRCCYYALMMMNNNMFKIVYPQLKTNCTDMEIDIEWINTNMNEQQQQAVRKILNKTAHPAPYIIFGPPGTGKTATLVEVICQIVKQFPMKNILVCTVSNAAADEITKRLIKIIPTNLIKRMYAPSKEWSTVDKEIQLCANIVKKTAFFLPESILLGKRIVITTLISSTRLIETNFRGNHFSYVIIDEASQAIEPEMLIPLMITNFETEIKRPNKETEFQAQIVIAGDPYQLGPAVRCKRIEHLLGRSMLERLMNDCDPYKQQDGKYNPNYITKLIKNYRSHESLLYVSNKQFYTNELETCGGADTRMALNWSQLPNKNFPMIFQEVLGDEERSKTRSVSNMNEILAVLIYVIILTKSKFGKLWKHTITPKDIGIITPFKQQQLDISYYLAAMNLKDITVGTVETFQGQERNVMILSTVRSKIFEHDGEEHIGFLSNPKRFNVALTRAKALMIIIGNPNVLCKDKHWKVLWKYCKKHDACILFKQLPLNEDIIATLNGITEIKSCNDSGASNATEEREIKTLDVVHKIENLKLK